MKKTEIRRDLGTALIIVGDSHIQATVPMKFTAHVDKTSIVRDATGKATAARVLITAKYDETKLYGVDWEEAAGDSLLLDSVNRFLRNVGIRGSVAWEHMRAQYPEIYVFKAKPYLVDDFFPELGHYETDELDQRFELPRPERGRPRLRLVV